jgi:cystathionine beta-lyase/cystathionine gamma-synthase
MSPVFQRPLELGADIVLHSATKYLNGHCDVVMGLVATSNDQLYERITYFQNALGGIPSPFDCYLVFRGIKTLHIRMERHEQNAMVLAKYLKEHSKIERVIYPGLPCHPQYELGKRQQRGFGGMVSIVLRGTQQDAIEFTKAVKIFTLAESLGGVESLIEIPYKVIPHYHQLNF